MHFLLHCSFYDDLRYELYESAFTIESNFYTFCDTDKLNFLMNNHNIQILLTKQMSKMFYRRRYAQ